MKKAKEILDQYIECICDDIYKRRKLTDPDCILCSNEEQIIEAMEEYAKQFKVKPVFSKSLKDIAVCKKCGGAKVWSREQNTVTIKCKNCEPNE